jgi:hypothetical protein
MMELAAAMATMPKKSGTRPMGGQSGFKAPRMAVVSSPMGAMAIPTRPPLIANKARGTISSANRAAMGGMF